jgi:hypothetical protein
MAITIGTIKMLFALSCNHCYYEKCEQPLTDPSWDKVNADIAHICGDKPGAPRHDPTMTPEERDDFDNLMLLCPNCHRRIDGLEPDQHPPDRLRDMKAKHIERGQGTEAEWASDNQLEIFALLVIGEPAGERPRLIVRRDGNSVEIVNVGDADAQQVRVETPDQFPERYVQVATISPGRLTPGEVWRAGTYVLSYETESEKPLRVSWADDGGEHFETTVNLAAI